MTRIALVVSDVDGTLVTKDKILTDAAKGAVRRLRRCRHRLHHRLQPPADRHALSDRAAGESRCRSAPFNGSSIVDPQLNRSNSI